MMTPRESIVKALAKHSALTGRSAERAVRVTSVEAYIGEHSLPPGMSADDWTREAYRVLSRLHPDAKEYRVWVRPGRTTDGPVITLRIDAEYVRARGALSQLCRTN